MKRSLFILLLLCSCLLPATRAAAQRGLPGQVGIQVGAGVADGFLVRRSGGEYTFGAEVAVTRNNANRTFWKFAAGYLRRDYRYLRQLVPQEQYTAQAGYFLQLLHDRRYNLSLAVGAEALIGYETVNRGRRTLEDGDAPQPQCIPLWWSYCGRSVRLFLRPHDLPAVGAAAGARGIDARHVPHVPVARCPVYHQLTELQIIL